ncbi:MAG: hypothetical protein IKU39_06935 [Lachnospiraceae bacterium]|nr:hypothetical protein [Lachnospiraceae bacterium]
MTEKLDKKNDDLFPFQTYIFRNTVELETICPSAFDMMLNPVHEHELWIGNINGLVSPTSEYGLAIKLKGYIIAGKKLTFILPENYEAIRPDNGNIGFRKTVLDMIRLGESRGQIKILTYSIEHAEDDINNKILKKISEAKMKFDVAILNPPYDGNLHLDILEKVIPLADKIVNISPIRWLQDPLATNKPKSAYKKYEDTISKKIEDLKPIDSQIASKLFNAGLPPMGIYVIGNGGFDYIKFNCNIIVNKIRNKHLKPVFEENKYDGIRVKISKIYGGGTAGTHSSGTEILRNIGKLLVFSDGMNNGKIWYDCYNKNGSTKIQKEIPTSIKFNSITEAENFCNTYQTKLAKYYTHCVKVDVHVHPETILWVEDYTKPWDDKRFCEYFGITGYIDDDHAEPGSEWETILKTMEQYK